MCVFCQKKRRLTAEHVLPDWLKTLYPNEKEITNELLGKTQKTWSSKIFEHKAKVVCKECNEGWMSELENKAKPIITKLVKLDNFILNETSQSILSFWSQKTVLMLNQATPGGIRISQDLYDDLYKNKNYSKKVLVNIGWRMNNTGNKKEPISSFEMKQITSVKVPKDIFIEVERQKDAGGVVWKAVLAIGPLVFELIGHNMKVILEINMPTKVLKTIQPYSEFVNWPLEWPIEAEGGLDVIKSR